MLDIQYIRENPDKVSEKSKQKGYEVDIAELLRVDNERHEALKKIEELRAKRNENAKKMKDGKPTPELIDQGKKIKTEIAQLEKQYTILDSNFTKLLAAVPNMPLDYVPIGVTEDENVITKTIGRPQNFDFIPRHDYQLGEMHDLIDKERATKIAGSRFAYLKGDLVRLQFAIVQFVLQVLTDERIIQKLITENNLTISSKPFTPVLPPAMLRTEPYRASARLNAEEVTYKIEQDDLWLNASAEHTLCTMYWNEILPEEMFPIRYIGYATSFRREAGTYGKDEEGIFRMHQFDKMEMESFVAPENGLEEHKLQVAIQEYLLQQVGLPYQLLQKCTADIGKPNAAGVDINCWFPGQGKYRETHTADYITDYQSRDLKIRMRRTEGNKLELVHTADATAFAMSRILKAILENFQTVEGKVIIPEVLRPYMGMQSEI
jgi:seryl-tRNA synthetase